MDPSDSDKTGVPPTSPASANDNKNKSSQSASETSKSDENKQASSDSTLDQDERDAEYIAKFDNEEEEELTLGLKSSSNDADKAKSVSLSPSNENNHPLPIESQKKSTVEDAFILFQQSQTDYSKMNDNYSSDCFCGKMPCVRYRYCGLRNCGFTCYSNSVLQVIYQVESLRTHIFDADGSGRFHALLSRLFNDMVARSMESETTYNYPIASPEEFNTTFREVKCDFRPNQQHDAQEFLTILLELLHQEVNRAVKPSKSLDHSFANAQEAWEYHIKHVDDSFLSGVVMGQIETTLTCLTCQHQSMSWSAFWQLQLDLAEAQPGKAELSLSDCITEFSANETFSADCSQCAQSRSSSKRQLICRVPSLLVIHLKRFSATGSKNGRTVLINDSLELCGKMFQLHSCIIHLGDIDNGHYVTLTRQSQRHFARFDDDRIDDAIVPQVAFEHEICHSAYLCVYQQKDDKWSKDTEMVEQTKAITTCHRPETSHNLNLPNVAYKDQQEQDGTPIQSQSVSKTPFLSTICLPHRGSSLSACPIDNHYKYCGLKNSSGYTDFLNSILQMLYMAFDLRMYIIKNSQLGIFHYELSILFRKMERLSNPVANMSICTMLFCIQFRQAKPQFGDTRIRHDAHEAYKALIELLHQEGNQVAKQQTQQSQNKTVRQIAKNAEEAWQDHLQYTDNSYFSQILLNQMATTETCSTCGRDRISWNVTWQLNLHFSEEVNSTNSTKVISLNECIQQLVFHCLKQTTSAFCDQCQCVQQMVEKKSISRLASRYLSIRLNRFSSFCKITQPVTIEHNLVISDRHYSLCSVVIHRGTNKDGHYATLFHDDVNKCWTLIDDQKITFRLQSDHLAGLLQSFAYICWYKAIDQVI